MAIPEIDELLEQEEQEEKEERFVIDTDKKATWAMRKIRKNNEKIKEKKELAQEVIDDLKEEIRETEKWLEQETNSIKEDNEFFEGLLKQYAEKLREENEDLKTHKLPFGKLQFRKQRPKWNYNDYKLMDSLKEAGFENTSIIQIKERVHKNELKDAVSEGALKLTGDGRVINPKTGEIIEGVEVQERGEKVKVKVD